jgi:hypothetical protein
MIWISLSVYLVTDPRELKLGLVVELVSAAALAVPNIVFGRCVEDLANYERIFIEHDSEFYRQVEKVEARRDLGGLSRWSNLVRGPSRLCDWRQRGTHLEVHFSAEDQQLSDLLVPVDFHVVEGGTCKIRLSLFLC